MITPIPYYDLICFEMYGKKSDAFIGIVTMGIVFIGYFFNLLM